MSREQDSLFPRAYNKLYATYGATVWIRYERYSRDLVDFFWKATLSKLWWTFLYVVPELFEGCYISCWTQISSSDLILDANTNGFEFWDLYPAYLLNSCSCNSLADLYAVVYLIEWHEIFLSIESDLGSDQDSQLVPLYLRCLCLTVSTES